MITEYKIAAADSEQKLVDDINSLIREGWQPLGGIAVAISRPSQLAPIKVVAFQAMVRTGDTPNSFN